MISKRITDALNNKPDNYILPFFWQKNNSDEELLNEIHAIYDSGIKALCVESRDFEGFETDCWWHTMDVILEECKKLDMKVWLLDDSAFPSGKGNGAFIKRPDIAACGITERHCDVTGPVTEGSVLSNWETSEEDELVAILACERKVKDEILTGKTIDLTDNVSDGMVYFDLPEGCWRIMFFYKTRSGMMKWGHQYADMLCPEATDLFIESVYEEHYKRYSEYFGNTFVGFFSDEPCLANATNIGYIADLGIKYCHFPWRTEFLHLLDEKFEGGFTQYLPALWYDMGEMTAKARFEYMDLISKRYSENICRKVGDWCRAHNVMYIGHVIEDVDQCSKTSAGDGHYFRALDGQDMGGIDTVLGQTTPGMTNYSMVVPCSYDISDPDFFHFTLTKLASSHSHIQHLKKGRAMCEIFGAYGWAEGLRMMKWMADMLMVRGVNHFVPHAFSPKFPDEDCPPHFYAHGTNPEFRKFRILMEYMNRVSHIINGGLHVSTVALLYHVEAEWASKNYTPCDKLARVLTENQLDYDIIPTDYIAKSFVVGNKISINGESYSYLLVPQSEYLGFETLKEIKRLSSNGVTVIFEDSLPTKCADRPEVKVSDYIIPGKNLFALELDKVANYIKAEPYWDVKTENYVPYLRCYHYKHEENDVFFLTNEGIHDKINTKLDVNGFKGGEYGVYDILENKIVKKTSKDGKIEVELSPYSSVAIILGDLPENVSAEPVFGKEKSITLDEKYSVSIAKEAELPMFKPYKKIEKLVNMAGKNELPRFAGHYRYEKTFELDETGADAVIDLGNVGELATVYVNGVCCGDRIAPPYRFDISKAVKNGKNELCIDVTTHYGHELRDQRSRYLLYEPTGLLGPVKVEIKK